MDTGSRDGIPRSEKMPHGASNINRTPEGEPLILYLSAPDIAIGAVLLTDRKAVQTPIYYVRRTLADAETRYSMLEKLVLALVYAARRLKRPAIKGQVLADFITEVPTGKVQACLLEQQPPIPSDDSQQWTLFTEGASSGEGSGAGLKLINPDGQEFTYSIKLNIKSTNNEAEYEAFLAGLRIARKLGVKFLEARVDSMLITGQVSGTYEAKNDVMASYLSHAKDLMQQFTSCKVVHIKISENRPVDAFPKSGQWTSWDHGHHWTIPQGSRTSKVPIGRYRLLHKVGGGQAAGQYNSNECEEIPVGIHHLPVRPPSDIG
ncbi:uncharacterized protein LOC143529102 [Bidens hawaiensis]|uniref:uncharacterized protein LOC143529102 n=1 Tax=Bidens hawaiensis TaxID=980011 RepID=UPI00404A3CD0